jgi:hypothetical protein
MRSAATHAGSSALAKSTFLTQILVTHIEASFHFPCQVFGTSHDFEAIGAMRQMM